MPVSQALRMMRPSGVVSGRRSRRSVLCRLPDTHVRPLLDVTRDNVPHEHEGEQTGKAVS